MEWQVLIAVMALLWSFDDDLLVELPFVLPLGLGTNIVTGNEGVFDEYGFLF